MSISNPIHAAKQESNKQLAQAIIAYVIFCGLSLLSQVAYPVFGLVTLMGLALPLAWGKFTGNWSEMGFTKHNLRSALLWGIVTGILASIIGVAVVPQRSPTPRLGLQLAIGIPIWALIASPFQEFFFRGWLQSRFGNTLGKWWGLLVANACFTLWHYFAPFVGRSTVPLETPIGALSTFGAGLMYAYSFQRTRNIIAPWLAHVLTGITFIVVGAMDFTQPML
jgi:membrane protease YdiL (CAAX protease family)